MRNFWEVTLAGQIAYPLLHVEPAGAGTGLMDIIVDLTPPDFDHPPFDLNNLPGDYTPVQER